MISNFISRNINLSLLKQASICSLIYCILFNSSVSIFQFSYYKASLLWAFIELTKEFVYIFIATTIFFMGMSINRLLLRGSIIFLFLTGSAASYYLYSFQINPTKEVVRALFATHSGEAYELISLKLIFWIIFNLIIAIFLSAYAKIIAQSFTSKLISIICLFLSISSIISPHYKVLNAYFPIKYFHSAYGVAAESFRTSKKIDLSQEYSFSHETRSGLKIILVIGESARYDHFSINGYTRETTPLLSKIDDLYSYKARSCANLTHISVPCLLSKKTSAKWDNLYDETTIISIFNELNYETIWLGTQSLMKHLGSTESLYDEPKFVIVPGGSALYKANDHDEVMLPYIENFLKKDTTNQFLVIHTSGSHWNYEKRYPRNFEKFQPVCKLARRLDASNCKHEGLINSYDNTILYTDYFLSSLINLVKDKNAFVIYTSDHGESLGEEGRFSHGGDPRPQEQLQVPFIAWFSGKFKQNHPEKVLAAQSLLGTEFNHDHVFHSILNCAGISSQIIDQSLSICK